MSEVMTVVAPAPADPLRALAENWKRRADGYRTDARNAQAANKSGLAAQNRYGADATELCALQLSDVLDALPAPARTGDGQQFPAEVPLRLAKCTEHPGRVHAQIGSAGEWACLRGLADTAEAGVPKQPAGDSQQAAEAERDKAYRERAALIAFLAACYPAVMDHDENDGDDDGWYLVTIDTPSGQMSWHLHPDDAELFPHVPEGKREWDGHTTELKYRRLASLTLAINASHAGGVREQHHAAQVASIEGERDDAREQLAIATEALRRLSLADEMAGMGQRDGDPELTARCRHADRALERIAAIGPAGSTAGDAAPGVVGIEMHRWYAVIHNSGGEVVSVIGSDGTGLTRFGSVEEWEASE